MNDFQYLTVKKQLNRVLLEASEAVENDEAAASDLFKQSVLATLHFLLNSVGRSHDDRL